MKVHPAILVAVQFQAWAERAVGGEPGQELADLVTPESIDQWDPHEVHSVLGEVRPSTVVRHPPYTEEIAYVMFPRDPTITVIPPGGMYEAVVCSVPLYHDGRWRVHALGDYWHPPGIMREPGSAGDASR